MSFDKFQMIANCYGGSNVLHMLILHSKCSINVPTSCVQPGTCRNIWSVPNLLSAGKWQVLSTRACNVLKMFLLVSRPPCPQCYYVAQMKRCTQKWDRRNNQGPNSGTIDTCRQLVGIVGTGLYHSMADVQSVVGRTVDPALSALTD